MNRDDEQDSSTRNRESRSEESNSPRFHRAPSNQIKCRFNEMRPYVQGLIAGKGNDTFITTIEGDFYLPGNLVRRVLPFSPPLTHRQVITGIETCGAFSRPPPSAVPRRTPSQRSLNLMGPLVNPASASARAITNYAKDCASSRARNGRAHFYDAAQKQSGREEEGGSAIFGHEDTEATR